MNDPNASPYNADGYVENGLRDAESHRRFLMDVPPGLHISRRSLPPGLVVIEDYLSSTVCNELVTHAREETGTPSTVQAGEAMAGETLTRLSADRVTDYIDIAAILPKVLGLMKDVFVSRLGPHYRQAIEWYERPELLRYRAGGHYMPHADAENWDRTTKTWRRSIDRDFSVLLYLNDDFVGGGLEFPNFGLRLAPKAGMLVAFPSDHRYVHAAQATTSGERYVLVSWCAARGTQRTSDESPEGAILLG